MPARLAIARFALALPVLLMAIVLAALALIAVTPARSAPLEPAGCARNLSESAAQLEALKVQLKGSSATDRCSVTRLYFLETVKARAIAALCKSGGDRDRELSRLDADVETINRTIAASCS